LSDIADNYIKELHGQAGRVVSHVVEGKCGDYAEYLAKIAEIRAYKRCLILFEDEMDKYVKDESEDDEDE